LERLVVNLLDNAIRHGRLISHPRAVVDLKLEPGDGAITLEIRDHGPGIPQERHAEALRPFARLDAARTDQGGIHAGTGLGLAIVSRIVRRYGGTVALSSAPGGGLQVRLQLPNWIDPS
jgi:two-component system osmolarity sensor histidine kinase EnvZ